MTTPRTAADRRELVDPHHAVQCDAAGRRLERRKESQAMVQARTDAKVTEKAASSRELGRPRGMGCERAVPSLELATDCPAGINRMPPVAEHYALNVARKFPTGLVQSH